MIPGTLYKLELRTTKSDTSEVTDQELEEFIKAEVLTRISTFKVQRQTGYATHRVTNYVVIEVLANPNYYSSITKYLTLIAEAYGKRFGTPTAQLLHLPVGYERV